MSPRPPAWKLWSALSAIYLIWGSTYLAIKVSVRTLPPLFSAGLRFVAAGAILAVVLALAGTSLRVSRRELMSTLALGAALITFGVGIVTLAETRIDSGVAAMIAGTVPLQVVAWRAVTREHVAAATRASVAIGLVGLALVVLPGTGGNSAAVGLALMVGATISWSTGSFASRQLVLPENPFVATALEMLGGGVLLILLALVRGEGTELHASELSAKSVAAWAYLVLAGSLVGFTAYAWLLRHAPISQVVTHQYVNPLVAVVLGALILGESVPTTTAIGAALIVSSVFVVVRRESRSA